MPDPRALQHEMHLQMLRLGNRVSAMLIGIAAIGINLIMRPDLALAGLSLLLAAALLVMAHLARPGRTGLMAGLSLGLLGSCLSAIYVRGVTMSPTVDLALQGAVLLPLVAYACLIGSGWLWLAGVTVASLCLLILSFIVKASAEDQLLGVLGFTILAYGIIYTIGAATVGALVTVAHRRVLAIAEAEAEAARQHATELRVAEARIRAVLDAVQNPIYAKDSHLRYIDCNAAFCTAIGFTREQVLGRTVTELIPDEQGERFNADDLRLLAAGGLQVYETTVPWADGTQHPALFHKALVAGGDGRFAGLVGSIVDLSDQRRMHDRLVESEKMEAIGRLAGGVAHDMNNQLAGILGFAELLERRLPAGQEREDALAIAVAARRAADLPRRLLAFARKGDYLATPVDMHRLIDEVGGILGRSIGTAIRIERRLGAGNSVVDGDPGQLQSMLLNLSLNARDAMAAGGRLSFTTADLVDPDEVGCDGSPLPPGRYLRIDVVDTGHGMDESVRKRLFEPFFTTKAAGKGTGLGLASVYGAVRIHRGAISVRSEPEQGSTFSIILPVTSASPERHRTPLPVETAPARPLRILVVDDEPIVRAVVAAQLRRLGHEPLVHESGAEALAAIRAGCRPEGAVIDLMMPEMDGSTLFHRLRELLPDLPIAIASGFHDDHAARELLDAGAVAFLAKPHGVEDIARIFGRPSAGASA